LFVSAENGTGIPELLARIQECLADTTPVRFNGAPSQSDRY